MKLILGGAYQGKTAYALASTGFSEDMVGDGDVLPLDLPCEKPVLNRLHLLIKRLLEAGLEPKAWLEQTLEQNDQLVIICNEVGCGVVPISGEERCWREEVGRLCCWLAGQSSVVERVYAGIVERLKG